MKPYDPETHDPLVKDLHDRWGLKAYEIGSRIGVRTEPVHDAKRRMGLTEQTRRMITKNTDREPAPPKLRQNPLVFAKAWLMARFVEKASGFWLDGVPVSLDTLMRAANTAAKDCGAEQLVHSERWRA